jgi:hypothetical protein
MKQFYLFRLKNPVFYDELLPTNIQKPLLQDVLTILPLRSQHGRRILLIEVGKYHAAVLLFYLRSRTQIANDTQKYVTVY